MPALLRDSHGNLVAESLPMRTLRAAHLDQLAWPLRRLHVPVSRDALVLEVGSGGNPYPRSNVLLDAYESTRERHFEPLVTDRPTVLGMVENMPFRDDAFDFVIASHVLEHSLDVEAFLRELQRVALAGYIETPDAFFERVNPYTDHRFEVTDRMATLRIRPKRAWREDPDVVELYEAKVKRSLRWLRFLRRDAFSFHVRYYWSRNQGGIRYDLSEQAGPREPIEGGGEGLSTSEPATRSWRRLAVRAARGVFSQRARNASLQLLSLLRCPHCNAEHLVPSATIIACPRCQETYPISTRFIRMIPSPPSRS